MVFNYNFEVLVLYLSISIICCFVFLLIHLFELKLLVSLQIWINNTKYNQQMYYRLR